jgi:Icc-related predicted phosphoesterase
MVKILAASDIHGSYSIMDSLAKKATKHNVDLVILAGDINGNITGTDKILNPFIREGKKVLFIPGNWDSTEEHEVLQRKAKSIHNYYVTYDGVGIVGFGSPDMKFKHTKDDFFKMKAQFERMDQRKKIFVSHLHAKGTKAEFSGLEGDEMIRKVVEEFQPDLLLSGHIHEAEGIEGKIGNTNVFQLGRSGKIFEI